MAFDSSFIITFLVVTVISSFCVSIGVGGGILYVPILGRLYRNVPQGVYLSKISIVMTSFIGSAYHLINDIILEIQTMRKNKNSNCSNENTTNLDSNRKIINHPRVFLELITSVSPWCIVGSNIGTTFHFFAKEHLKYVLTSILLLCLLFTVFKLSLIYSNRKTKSNSNDVIPVSRVCYEENVSHSGNDSDKNKKFLSVIYKFFSPFNSNNLHSAKNRLISFFLIVLCLVLYYISLKFEKIYVTLPLMTAISALGFFYSIKLRLSFRDKNFYSKIGDYETGSYSRKLNYNRKIRKILDTGVHFIVLNIFVGLISGFFSGTIGIGSGVIILPFLQYLNLPPISCSGTSNSLTLVVSIATLLRFIPKITLEKNTVLPVLVGSFIGTSLSIFFIRAISKDKITSVFVNITLIIFCITSVIITWTIQAQ